MKSSTGLSTATASCRSCNMIFTTKSRRIVSLHIYLLRSNSFSRRINSFRFEIQIQSLQLHQAALHSHSEPAVFSLLANSSLQSAMLSDFTLSKTLPGWLNSTPLLHWDCTTCLEYLLKLLFWHCSELYWTSCSCIALNYSALQAVPRHSLSAIYGQLQAGFQVPWGTQSNIFDHYLPYSKQGGFQFRFTSGWSWLPKTWAPM